MKIRWYDYTLLETLYIPVSVVMIFSCWFQIVPSQREKLDCIVSLDLSQAYVQETLSKEHYNVWSQLYHEIAVKWILNAITTGAHILKGKIYQNIMVDLKVRYNDRAKSFKKLLRSCNNQISTFNYSWNA